MGICLSCLGLSRQSSSDVRPSILLCLPDPHLHLLTCLVPPCSRNAPTSSIPTIPTMPLAMATEARAKGWWRHDMCLTRKTQRESRRPLKASLDGRQSKALTLALSNVHAEQLTTLLQCCRRHIPPSNPPRQFKPQPQAQLLKSLRPDPRRQIFQTNSHLPSISTGVPSIGREFHTK